MSIRHVCDFCGEIVPLEGEPPCKRLGGVGVIEDGIVDRKHYCSAFQDRLDERKKRLDEAHEKARKLFQEAFDASRQELERDA